MRVQKGEILEWFDNICWLCEKRGSRLIYWEYTDTLVHPACCTIMQHAASWEAGLAEIAARKRLQGDRP